MTAHIVQLLVWPGAVAPEALVTYLELGKYSAMTADTPATVPQRSPVEPTGLHLYPYCGAWQWRLGLRQSLCAQCGWREESTPAARHGAGGRSTAC